MAVEIAANIRRGNIIEYTDGQLYSVLKAESFRPGKGTPTTTIEMAASRTASRSSTPTRRPTSWKRLSSKISATPTSTRTVTTTCSCTRKRLSKSTFPARCWATTPHSCRKPWKSTADLQRFSRLRDPAGPYHGNDRGNRTGCERPDGVEQLQAGHPGQWRPRDGATAHRRWHAHHRQHRRQHLSGTRQGLSHERSIQIKQVPAPCAGTFRLRRWFRPRVSRIDSRTRKNKIRTNGHYDPESQRPDPACHSCLGAGQTPSLRAGRPWRA
jgi:hypothetical protein